MIASVKLSDARIATEMKIAVSRVIGSGRPAVMA
jgi:hypothetical protein